MPTLSPSRNASTVLLLTLTLCLLAFCARAQAQGATVLGWGHDNTGQVDGAQAVSACQCLTVPTQVPGVSEAVEVATGTHHTLALRSDGTVLGWGANGFGDLGLNETLPPAQIAGLSGVVSIATGEDHTLALLADGRVEAMGSNLVGQLGLGSATGPESCNTVPCSTAPVIVPGLDHIIAIAAGEGFSLALRGDGRVFAWGDDEQGEVGDAAADHGACRCVPAPTLVPGVTGGMSIAAGENAAYALLGDGTVKAWGRSTEGQLGDGKGIQAGCRCQGPVGVPGIPAVDAIAAGAFGAIVIPAGGGPLVAWGSGSLAEGPSTSDPSCEGCIPPSPVRGGLTAAAVAEGQEHIVALRTDGSVQAWGQNQGGELGSGSTSPTRETPAPVPGVSGASGVAAGSSQSFALIGSTEALRVSRAGTGAGVVGGPAGILCPGSCTHRYPQGGVEILRAEARGKEAFAGFSGACTGTAPCQVKLDGDRSVTATFGRPKGTKIAKATVSSPKRKASFSLAAPGAITGYQCQLARPRPARHGGHRPAVKRRPRFARCSASVTYTHLTPGRYTFKARALDSVGADPRPATRTFVIKPRHRHA